MTGPAAPRPVRPFLVTHWSVLRIALPMTLAYLSTPLVGLIATGVIGQLGNAAMIGGVALGAVIFDVVFVSFNFLRGATTGFTAQATGAGDRQEEQDMLLGGLAIAAIAGGVILLLQAPLATVGLAALGAHGEIAEAGRAYYDARVWSAPASAPPSTGWSASPRSGASASRSSSPWRSSPPAPGSSVT